MKWMIPAMLIAAATPALAQNTVPLPATHEAPQPPMSAEAIYNQAVQLQREGKVDQARAMLKQAIAQTADKNVEARARYNLGNAAYAQALDQSTQGQRDEAIAGLNEAIGHYRDALRLNPADQDARVNIELARQLIDKLKEQKKQDEQQQQQQQQDKQDQQQNKDQQPQDQKNQQQNQNQNQQQNDPQQNQQQNPQDQQDPSQQGQQNDQQKNQDPSQQQNPQQGDEQQQATQKQQQGQQPQPNKGEQSAQKQQPSGEKASAAKPSGGDLGDYDPDKNQKPLQAVTMDQLDKLNQEEAAQLLQAVRDRYLERRTDELRQQQAQQAPVDKDW